MKPGYAKRRNDRIVRSGAAGPDAVEPMALVDCRLPRRDRSEEHTSELQSQSNLVCRLLLEKKKNKTHYTVFAVCPTCCMVARLCVSLLDCADSPCHFVRLAGVHTVLTSATPRAPLPYVSTP